MLALRKSDSHFLSQKSCHTILPSLATLDSSQLEKNKKETSIRSSKNTYRDSYWGFWLLDKAAEAFWKSKLLLCPDKPPLQLLPLHLPQQHRSCAFHNPLHTFLFSHISFWGWFFWEGEVFHHPLNSHFYFITHMLVVGKTKTVQLLKYSR